MQRILTRWKAIGAAILIWAAGPSAVNACETCWGAGVDNPTTQGIAVAMLLLLGTTGLVGSGIGAFFLHMRRRSRLLEPGDMVVTEYGEIRPSSADPSSTRD